MRPYFLIGFGVLSAAAFAGGDDILDVLSQKAKGLKYSGTRVISLVRAGKIERHEEYVTRSGSNMRIEFSRESPFHGQIIVETANERRHYFPDQNEIMVFPTFGRHQFDSVRGSFRDRKRGAKITTGEGENIVGFRTSKIRMADRDGNPIFDVYADMKSGLTLKRVMYDPAGGTIGTFEFTKLTLNPKLMANAFSIQRNGAKIVRPIDLLRRKATSIGMEPVTLKSGSPFKLETVFVREIKGIKVLVQNFVKPDSRITLFATKSSLGSNDMMGFKRKELSSHMWQLNGVTLILMGSESQDALKALARQVAEDQP
ncbi:MAG TPA: hypothetical protein VK171_04575 [Fimbriimonas sp.]|nr:hypothetical protein [Fimbriimonas sp.]